MIYEGNRKSDRPHKERQGNATETDVPLRLRFTRSDARGPEHWHLKCCMNVAYINLPQATKYRNFKFAGTHQDNLIHKVTSYPSRHSFSRTLLFRWYTDTGHCVRSQTAAAGSWGESD